MAADFKTAEPLEYYRQFLKEDIRPDGRGFKTFRKTTVNVGSISTAEGSALLKLGNTTVICGIKAELSEPKLDSPKQGYLVPNVDLPPLCSPQFRPGPPSEEAQVLNHFFADIISNSQLINSADLCIVESKLVWVLYIDMICLDYDGNIIDACMAAMLAALRNTKLYGVTINEETQSPELSKTKEISLCLRSQPVASTFGIFDNTYLYVDPTNEEEKISTGTITVVVSSDNKLISVQKPGCSSISNEKLQECFKQAVARSREVCELIETACTHIDR